MRSFSAWKRRNFYWRETTVAVLRTAYRVFSENSQSLFKTFLSFKSTFASFPTRFPRSKILLLLPLHDFMFQKCFCCFPDVFSVFKNTFVACPARFRTSKALSLLSRRVFELQKFFRCFLGAVSGFKRTFFIRFKQKSIH